MRWLIALACLAAIHAHNPLPLPPLGWSTWNTFKCKINDTLVRESILALAESPVRRAGYEWILIDDCWTTCLKRDQESLACLEPGPRDSKTGRIIPGENFPNGFQELTKLAHDKGLRIGIYTSVSNITCGGFVGSFEHEAIDAKAFAEWGFDFVKHDTCGVDYTVHGGGLQNATMRMRDALYTEGRGRIVYYLDSGNPTSPQRVFNPHQRHVKNQEALKKLAVNPHELVWVWATELGDESDFKGPHMFKSWFDVEDKWGSTLTNLHNQIRIAEYQRCGAFNNPDMLTVGMGGQTHGQYRAQFYLWVTLGAPLIMGNDVRTLDEFTVSLVTNPEVLSVNQDKDCVQGSLARALGATETWIKPLRDGTFAVTLLNKGGTSTNCTVFLDNGNDWSIHEDFFPASFPQMHVRDLGERKDLGIFHHVFSIEVPPMDAAIFKMSPV